MPLVRVDMIKGKIFFHELRDGHAVRFLFNCGRGNYDVDYIRDSLSGICCAMLVRRNEQIIIEKPNISLMRNYQAQRLIKIYSWASDNGYRDIWTPPQGKVCVNG